MSMSRRSKFSIEFKARIALDDHVHELSPQHLLHKLSRNIASRIEYPMNMHHGFKCFVDYALWMGMYFTVAGDAHYFKFWGEATPREIFQNEGGLLKLA